MKSAKSPPTMNDVYGHLDAKAHRRRKIDVWTFRSPFKDQEEEYRAEIYMSVNRSKGTLLLRAFSAHFPEKWLDDTDVARLRQKVEEAFRLADMKARSIRWEDWVEIEMGEEFDFKDEHSAILELKWRFLKRGLHPDTGKAYTIHHSNNVVIPFPLPKAAGENDQGKGREWYHGSRDEDRQYSYIPATPANVEALEALAARIRDVRARLRTLLNQENAPRSLASAGTLALEDKR